ncbi:MAG TPA: 16S rRNA (guanine(966)-N(2))-methyltransferase RsmD [Ruminococcaceae bacterium]|nr:16S rRNA (guanine(966)-N(2))-methyltransferase RsmD [Oscillospiraceae bacterium]
MRVITGTAKGRRLKTLPGLDVRPTIEGVKEAIFSIVQFEIEDAVVLDLFSGSGQLGIEALSRGAKKAVFVDSSAESIKIIKDNLRHTGLEANAAVCNMANNAFLRSTKEKFDIAILDPPYNRKLIQKSMPQLVEKMTESGIIICEHEKETILPQRFGDFAVSKIYRHGRVSLTAYRKSEKDEEDTAEAEITQPDTDSEENRQ